MKGNANVICRSFSRSPEACWGLRRMTGLRRYGWLLGPCYGIAVLVVMHTVVLPLAPTYGSGALSDGPCGPDGKITDHQMLYATILAHMFIVWLVRSACARFLWPKNLGPKEELAQ